MVVSASTPSAISPALAASLSKLGLNPGLLLARQAPYQLSHPTASIFDGLKECNRVWGPAHLRIASVRDMSL